MANKALVGSFNGGILIGGYSPPLNFSVSGQTVIELPTGFPSSSIDGYPAITLNKINFLMNENPTYSNNIYDELFTDTNIDYANSTGITTNSVGGPTLSKNTSIENSGILQTNALVFAFASSYVTIYYEVYTLYNDIQSVTEPGPDRILYNYDSISSTFIEPSPSDLTCEYSADAGPFLPVVSGTEINMGAPKANIALKFTNPGNKIYLSSFAILYKV